MNKNFIIIKKELNLPSLITIITLIIAIFGNYLLLNKNYYIGFYLILLACIGDILDGYIARKLKQESIFGRNLDSFTDIFTYIFPIIIVLFGNYGNNINILLISSIYLIFSILRLSYFNSIGLQQDKNKFYYKGLPVYYSYIILILIFFKLNLFILGILIILKSILMITNIKIFKSNIFINFIYILILFLINSLFYIGIL